MNVPDTVGVPLIVMVFDVHDAVTPDGKPVGVPIPVAPVVVCVISGDKTALIHEFVVVPGVTVFFGVTVIVPVALTLPQPPIKGMLKVNIPDTVGVPLIVIVFANQVAVTPDGKPVGVPIPVAPVVV